MNIEFKRSEVTEAVNLVEIYNAAFYEDHIRFHGCPGYGHTKEQMVQSIQQNLKYTIYADGKAVGVISAANKKNGHYHIGCLCIIPEYQGRGIGTKAIEYLKMKLTDWKEFTLETPMKKIENVMFYTKKCGFTIKQEVPAKNIMLYLFSLKR